MNKLIIDFTNFTAVPAVTLLKREGRAEEKKLFIVNFKKDLLDIVYNFDVDSIDMFVFKGDKKADYLRSLDFSRKVSLNIREV